MRGPLGLGGLPTSQGARTANERMARSNLALPGPQLPVAYFTQSAQVTVRLMRDDAGTCWESIYPASRRNLPAGFKAVIP